MQIQSTARSKAREAANKQLRTYEIPWGSEKPTSVDLLPVESYARNWIEKAKNGAYYIKSPWERFPAEDLDPSPNRILRRLKGGSVGVYETTGQKTSYSRTANGKETSASWVRRNFQAGEEYIPREDGAILTKLWVEGETLKVATNSNWFIETQSFDETPTQGWEKTTNSETTSLSGNKTSEQLNREALIRKNMTKYESVFTTNPKHDKDPSPVRFFDGNWAIDSPSPGIERALHANGDTKVEVIREDGKLKSVKERRIGDGTLVEVLTEYTDAQATKTTTRYQNLEAKEKAIEAKKLKAAADFRSDLADLASGIVGILGLGAIALAIFGGAI